MGSSCLDPKNVAREMGCWRVRDRQLAGITLGVHHCDCDEIGGCGGRRRVEMDFDFGDLALCSEMSKGEGNTCTAGRIQ